MAGCEPQDVLDALPDGVVLADADQRVTHCSAVAARMLGTDTAHAVGRPLSDVLRLQDQDGRAWMQCNAPYGGLSTRTGITEQSWLLPDGTEVLVAARLTRPRRAGPVAGVAVVLRSGRGRARLDRERSDLVATVAHELRSPLTGVKGFVQAMLNRWDKLNDEQKKLMLTTVAADSDRLSRLIAELLDVARIDTGRLQLYPRPVDPLVLLERVVASVGAGTHRTITLEADPATVPQIMADPDKFTQVVTNLVENAVRHGDGEVRVEVVAGQSHQHGTVTEGLGASAEATAEAEGIRVRVTDEGEGIPPELRRRVFTKFWTGGGRGGSGLGLYIVNGLVRAHGGAVEIADAPGGGASLAFDWPGVPTELR
ncbi:ATP-binding protein [Nocardioides sp. R-C-SC26]|uniref:sensor histidine kinase n=1 Tax=Nocardioides sp. R-C-SC26 TaxID=2870414 RepID=UPI001E5DC83E|nr:ATP-binding protein [Nocardioides sp. R-C-SC26]